VFVADAVGLALVVAEEGAAQRSEIGQRQQAVTGNTRAPSTKSFDYNSIEERARHKAIESKYATKAAKKIRSRTVRGRKT